MIRSTVAHVDLAALQANFKAIQHFLADGIADHKGPRRAPPKVIAVVKANAYGHGAERVALALEAAGADLLACADIEEGIVLRNAGVRAPILVFGALSVSDLDGLFEFSLTPTISSPAAARAVQAAAAKHSKTLGYHLKIDTGMNRLGFRHDNLRRTLPELLGSPNLRLDAIFTHFATADDPERGFFNEQREHFEAALKTIESLFPADPQGPRRSENEVSPRRSENEVGPRRSENEVGSARVLIHAANSAAMLRDSRVWYDMVRPGLLLYGIVPPPLATTIPLTPVMSLTSRVVAVKGVRPGEGIGYGLMFQADTPVTTAVIPAGYADGIDLRVTGRCQVLIRGRRVPIVGAVSMDMMMVDVTGLDDVSPGDEVVIIGRQGNESWQRIDAREMAGAIGTIPYEIVCRVGARIERQYD